jgi:hypothetical protein
MPKKGLAGQKAYSTQQHGPNQSSAGLRAPRRPGACPTKSLQPRTAKELILIGIALTVLISGAAWWFYHQGYILYYGDAQAHLDNSRSIIDSRTPGYVQLGTVWLPLLHLLCLPFVGNNWLWSTGLAGTIPVAVCFIFAGVCLYLAARTAYGCSLAAAVVVSCFALNPNALYLASIPMTEIVFLAGLSALLAAVLQFRATQRAIYVALGIVASWAMSFTRYDGWFLIPFAALWFARCASANRLRLFILFGLLTSLAPLYWMVDNWWQTGNPLDFFNGPYSAKAIQGGKPYPGYHDWAAAAHYYTKAGQLCAGNALLWVGIAGIFCAAVIKKARAPIGFLFLTPLFYIWSMHSSGNPIFVPQLWPHGHYNTRYGIAVVVLAAFSAGAAVFALPARAKRFAMIVPLVAVLPWILRPSREQWICWKESERNSISRRAWTREAAAYMTAHYRQGDGILALFGDITAIFCRAQIPIAETLHEGNGIHWLANSARPDLIHEELWAIAQEGDMLSNAIDRTRAPYHAVYRVEVKGAPALLIYHRVSPSPVVLSETR